MIRTQARERDPASHAGQHNRQLLLLLVLWSRQSICDSFDHLYTPELWAIWISQYDSKPFSCLPTTLRLTLSNQPLLIHAPDRDIHSTPIALILPCNGAPALPAEVPMPAGAVGVFYQRRFGSPCQLWSGDGVPVDNETATLLSTVCTLTALTL